MEDLISVIIPVYNRENYIEACIQSVLDQNYQLFEIILVDDGSTDNTISICQRFVEQDSRIKLFLLQHGGVSKARNKAIDEANGEYLFFMDSDDVIHPSLFTSLLKETKAHNVSVSAVCGIDVPSSKLNDRLFAEFIDHNEFTKVELFTNEQLIQCFFKRDMVFGKIGGIMLRKDYVNSTRFRESLFIGEDTYFIYENIIKGSEAVVLLQYGYFWRQHQKQSIRDASSSGFASRVLCKSLLWESEEKFGRIENANKEKRLAFDIFLGILSRNPLLSEESRKSRKIIRQYKKALFQALGKKKKLQYYFAVYLPLLFVPFLKMKSAGKRRRVIAARKK